VSVAGGTTSRRGLVVGLALGVPVMLFGVRGVLLDARDTHPAELARWLVGAAVVHDLVLLPVVGALGWGLRRLTPAPAWPMVRAGAIVVGTLALVAWPYAASYGASPGNPSLLPRDYVLGPALAAAAIAALTAVAAVATVGGVDVDVVTEVTIERPVAAVAAYAADPANAPEWYDNIDSVTWETQPPVAVSSRVAFVARFLGRRLAYTYEVVELVPGERLVMRTAQGPFPMETTYTWRPEGEDRTRMTLRNRGRPGGFARVGAPMMAATMRRANRRDLANLRTILEADGPAAL
jgi:uncharacterized membrane protein